jgi:hypothetical protein
VRETIKKANKMYRLRLLAEEPKAEWREYHDYLRFTIRTFKEEEPYFANLTGEDVD